jgi:hypothetical protein
VNLICGRNFIFTTFAEGGREGWIKDKWITTRSSPTAQTYGAMIKVGVNINLINNIFGVLLRKQI